tara:strand:+ start:143 stop:409 length:267 start_codon:yes stop_codon:yes gene_type:complete
MSDLLDWMNILQDDDNLEMLLNKNNTSIKDAICTYCQKKAVTDTGIFNHPTCAACRSDISTMGGRFDEPSIERSRFANKPSRFKGHNI